LRDVSGTVIFHVFFEVCKFRSACKHLAGIIKHGHKITITHGNGPQVEDILLKEECAKDMLPYMPLDICVAESQGMIGYMIQLSLRNELKKIGLDLQVATILTETIVDATLLSKTPPNQ
jgi:carbamate kinase